MGRKRKSGEGTVRLRKDGRWEGRIVIGYDEKGLPKTKNVLAKTKGECVEKLKVLKESLAPPTRGKVRADMPFGEWLDHWYETCSKPMIRPRTQRTYEGFIRLYIKPRLGGIPLNKLTTNDIQHFCVWMKSDDHMSGDSLADSQIRNCYSLCHRALERARAEHLIPRNPTEGCKLPPVRCEVMKILSREAMHKLLTQAREEKEVRELAGVFRAEYEPCPTLTMTLLGEREFHGDSGYAGVIYYFWEMDQERFYTYTWVRPTFYGQPARRKDTGYHPAPWQLEGEMGGLYEKKLELQGGRASGDRRLSSSEQSRAVILGTVKPWECLGSQNQYEDFGKMFQEKRPFIPDGPEADRVVLVIPKGYRTQEYDKIRQIFRLILLDGQGRSLVLEVKYRKEEERVVKALEQFARSLEADRDTGAAFLGICYVEEGRLKLYPIEIYRNWGGRT